MATVQETLGLSLTYTGNGPYQPPTEGRPWRPGAWPPRRSSSFPLPGWPGSSPGSCRPSAWGPGSTPASSSWCPTSSPPPRPRPSILAAYLEVLPACVAHGVGSAVGELPYLMANTIVSKFEKGSWAMRSHEWMVKCLREWGFWVVFLFALWPNALFDCCGLASGACGVNVWAFLGATVAGKALVKAPAIAFLVVATTKGQVLPAVVDEYMQKALNHEDSRIGAAWATLVALLTGWMAWTMLREMAGEERRHRRANQSLSKESKD